jgi:membrane-associated phospholipid phosphatase
MTIPEIQSVRDYNRGLPAPIRWIHILWAAALWPTRDIRAWATQPGRKSWAVPILWFGLLGLLFYPVDGPISRFFREHRLGGDIRRELEAAQQYGQLVSSLLIALVIWLQDPRARRRLAHWAAGFLVAGIVCNAGKMLVGRPRPMFDDPHVFLLPLGEYPISIEVEKQQVSVIRHAWEFWGKNAADLWSMPSSHTAYACLMAVVIGCLYPRLKVLAGALAGLVAFARIATGAHYPSDVAMGAAIGLSIGRTAMAFHWGEALLRLFVWVSGTDSLAGGVEQEPRSSGEHAVISEPTTPNGVGGGSASPRVAAGGAPSTLPPPSSPG